MADHATQRTALYASAGRRLIHYEIDADNAALIERATVTLPADVQYAWPHASRRWLYVVSQRRQSGCVRHYALGERAQDRRCDRRAAAHGEAGEPALAAAARQHRHAVRSSIDCLQPPERHHGPPHQRRRHDRRRSRAAGALDFGIFAHQVRVAPSNARGDRGHARQRRRGRQARGPGGASRFSITATAGWRTRRASRRAAATATGRATSIFIRRGRGCSSRSSARTSCRSTISPTRRWARRRCIRSARSPTSVTTARRRDPARCTCIRTGASSTCRTARAPARRSRAGAFLPAARTPSPSTRSIRRAASRRSFSTWTAAASRRAPLPSSRAGACWSPPT